MTITPMQRLYKKIRIQNDGCWIWTGARWSHGYGAAWYAGKTQRAHVLMFKLYGGIIPDGLVLDHLCRVTSCVNPEHLEPVTAGENTLRMIAALGTVNGKKTACPKGHAYGPTRITRLGHRKRRCPTCAREQSLAYAQRQKAVAA